MSDLNDIKAELSALKARVRLLEDETEICQLIAKYGPSVDSGSVDSAAELWTEDGVFAVVGGELSFEMVGKAQVAEMVSGEGHQLLIARGCAHVLSPPNIEIDGDTARGLNHAMNLRWDGENDRFWVARVSANEWQFVRTAHGWRVKHRTNSVLDGAAAARALLTPHQSTGRR